MTSTAAYSLRPIGFVRSRLTARKDAPKQGSEGAPEAWVEIDPAFGEALDGIAAGRRIRFALPQPFEKALSITVEFDGAKLKATGKDLFIDYWEKVP